MGEINRSQQAAGLQKEPQEDHLAGNDAEGVDVAADATGRHQVLLLSAGERDSRVRRLPSGIVTAANATKPNAS
jgi:hypothetical protein